MDEFGRFSQRLTIDRENPEAIEPLMRGSGDNQVMVRFRFKLASLGEGVVCSVNRFWNGFPRSRGLRTWNKWRIHLGSVLAAPHIIWAVLSALPASARSSKLQKIWQKL